VTWRPTDPPDNGADVQPPMRGSVDNPATGIPEYVERRTLSGNASASRIRWEQE
jgi:hypothetical protein